MRLEKSQRCHQEGQGTSLLLSASLAAAADTGTSVIPVHFPKSSLHPDQIRGRKLHCNKFREGTGCPGFNLRGAFRIRALRGDEPALVQERSKRVSCLGFGRGRWLYHALAPGSSSTLQSHLSRLSITAGHREFQAGQGTAHIASLQITEAWNSKWEGQHSAQWDTSEQGGI